MPWFIPLLQNLEREQDDGNQGKKYTSLPDSLKAFFMWTLKSFNYTLL